jgi:hypothetical protein
VRRVVVVAITRVSAILAAAVLAAAILAGCGSQQQAQSDSRASPAAPSATPQPTNTADTNPGEQTGWMHGIGVSVPASWPRNALRCGDPSRTTLIVQPTGAGTPLCFVIRPKSLHPDVVWMAAYEPPVSAGAIFGAVALPARGFATMTPVTVAGEDARELRTRDRFGEAALLIVFPARRVFVQVSSTHPALIDGTVASIRSVTTDVESGCAVHTTAYDAPPAHPRLDQPLEMGVVTAVSGCHYLGGWLESTADSMPAAKLARLVHALEASPRMTKARAPIDSGCERLDPGPPSYSDDGPVVLRLRLADGSLRVVVVRIVMCTRWQSYVASGDIQRRVTGELLLSLPPLLVQFPGPETMSG